MIIYHKIWNDNNPDDPIQKGDGNDIHHKDFNHDNNDPNNLEKMTHSEHVGLHNKNRIVSEQTRLKMSKNKKGRILSEEWKEKLSKNKIEYYKKNPKRKEQLSKMMKERMKLNPISGENHPKSKLNNNVISEIRNFLKSDEFIKEYENKLITFKEVANKFNINYRTLLDIKNNKTWRKYD